MIYKTLHIKQKVEQHEPTLTSGGELVCSGRVSCVIRRITIVTIYNAKI